MSALSDLVQMLKQDKKTGSDYTGTVTRVEGDTVYVRITGSDIMDTPVKMSIDAKAGDTVRVRVANGKAWLTGNDTAPPTNDTKKIQKIQNDLYEPGGKVSSITKIVEKVGQLAANTNQYFWRTNKGTDTGIHITEVPRDTFLKDPENGGSNLLARSNGIAVRDGLTELSQFTGSGVTIGKSDGFKAKVNPDAITLEDSNGVTGFRISLAGNSASRVITNTYNGLEFFGFPTSFTAPIADTSITFRIAMTYNSTSYSGNVTLNSSQLPVSSWWNLTFTGTNYYVRITRTGTDTFEAELKQAPGYDATASLQVSYTITRDVSKINFTGSNNVLASTAGLYMTANQSLTFSENVSEQLNGIVLVWSAYMNGAVQDFDWFYQFIPKDHVNSANGTGVTTGLMTNSDGSKVGTKYVYVYDDKVLGNANNSASNVQKSGITLYSNYWVLRCVLGV